MKKLVMICLAAALLLGAVPLHAQDTEYKATPVTISKDKVRENGKLYYSHVVLERQTLFSIAKAYGVTIQDIYHANPTLKLETVGLKTYQILHIPYVENAPGAEAPAPAQKAQTTVVSAPAAQPGEYIIHTVKWYEDLDSIAKKYGVSKEAIMKANGMTSPQLSRKQKLRIPPAGTEITEDIPVVFEEEAAKA